MSSRRRWGGFFQENSKPDCSGFRVQDIGFMVYALGYKVRV